MLEHKYGGYMGECRKKKNRIIQHRFRDNSKHIYSAYYLITYSLIPSDKTKTF